MIKSVKKEANTNGIKKLILSAAGEIALIVIGLLIALSIDNYKKNIDKKENTLHSINGLKRTLQQDFNQIIFNQLDSEEFSASCNRLINGKYKDKEIFKKDVSALMIFDYNKNSISNENYIYYINAIDNNNKDLHELIRYLLILKKNILSYEKYIYTYSNDIAATKHFFEDLPIINLEIMNLSECNNYIARPQIRSRLFLCLQKLAHYQGYSNSLQNRFMEVANACENYCCHEEKRDCILWDIESIEKKKKEIKNDNIRENTNVINAFIDFNKSLQNKN